VSDVFSAIRGSTTNLKRVRALRALQRRP